MQLKGFVVSNKPYKKYDAILYNEETGRTKRVSFGDTRYQQYNDKIGHYSKLDHHDPDRRRKYKQRHYKTHFKKFSPSWFSWYYLW